MVEIHGFTLEANPKPERFRYDRAVKIHYQCHCKKKMGIQVVSRQNKAGGGCKREGEKGTCTQDISVDLHKESNMYASKTNG